ncbi:MAG: dienelactone hydrolase family protein [Gemmatimonadales bacterium]|nr:dienelactone hydrolase family protein [Gemmatimonadales bacterium]
MIHSTIVDLILLVSVLALGAWRLIAPAWRPRLRIAAAGLALCLAAVQWARYGFTWQHLAAYPLLALSALPPLRTSNMLRWIGRVGLVGIAVASIGVWILPAVPTLPAPDGRYAVGTEISRWTDTSRDEPHTTDSSDRRSVIAQAWYPTTRREERGAPLPYIDGTDRMPSQVGGLPGFVLRRYDQIDSHAEASAPLAMSERPWPVVIFSPGYGAPRAVYTGLATRLASRGFVVFVLDHPYESGVTELPDGRVVGTEEHFPPGMTDRTQYMADQQRVRTADIRFVIDQLARPEALSPTLRGSRIDAAKVAVIGHSFGGAVSAMVMSEDPRVAAAANIDGTPYGDLPDRQLTRPFLLLQSDLAESPHGDLFHQGNGKLLTKMTAPGFRYELKRSNHFSFTDAPYFLARPGRWLLAQLMGGGRGPAATQQATADMLAAFLAGPLTGVHGDMTATAARYPDLPGGPWPAGRRLSDD